MGTFSLKIMGGIYIYHTVDKTYYSGLKGNRVVFKTTLEEATVFEEAYLAEDEIELLEDLDPELVGNLIIL